MNKNEQERRYEVASSLYELFDLLCASDIDIEEKLLDAIMDAAQIVSPEFIKNYEKEIIEGMNAPEVIAAVEETKDAPAAKAALELIKQRRKELGWDE